MGAFVRLVGIIVDISLLTALIGLSLAVTASIALVKGDFKENCPLFPTEVVPVLGYVVAMIPGGKANCNFLIGMHSVAAFIALVAGIYRMVEACKKQKLLVSSAAPVFFVVTYVLVALSTLSAACVITIGFNRLCDGLQDPLLPTFTCKDYQDASWAPYDGAKFYSYLITAEASAWLSFFSWTAISLFALLMAVCCKGRDQ